MDNLSSNELLVLRRQASEWRKLPTEEEASIDGKGLVSTITSFEGKVGRIAVRVCRRESALDPETVSYAIMGRQEDIELGNYSSSDLGGDVLEGAYRRTEGEYQEDLLRRSVEAIIHARMLISRTSR
ncbi:MAG TPA: hypothetical protein ENH99_01750 [Candidatus Pacearchaeota archaeon]|nr:hypothetical protein [Candidatus Pacearchaeota archaeon]